jgi:release factor glutamine methyltransferase
MKKIIKQITTESGLSNQEAWWLLESITEQSKERLLVFDYQLTTDEESKLAKAVHKIKEKSAPLAYVIGNVPFGELTINVRAPILIPRPETEEWVHQLIEQLKPHKTKIKSILDIGTGSGCIALALAHAFPQAKITATDLNPLALELAQENAEKNNIKNIKFVKSDLFKNIQDQTFDLIVSNPPYIAQSFEKTLDKSVIEWEDHGALFAPNNGLELIDQIIEQLPRFLSKEKLPTKFVVECDPEQIDTIINLLKNKDFNSYSLTDSFGNQRTVWAS